jgi:repressor LexA
LRPLHVNVGARVTRFSLTKKQQAMLAFIERYFGEHRQSPLIREIQVDCQIASYKSAIDRLNALERKGLIRRTPNKHRGIKVLRRPATPSAGTEQPAAVPSITEVIP